MVKAQTATQVRHKDFLRNLKREYTRAVSLLQVRFPE
jgi:hypothetical protein